MTTTWKCKSNLVEFNHDELMEAVDIVWTNNAAARERFETKERFLDTIVRKAEREFHGSAWGLPCSFFGLFMCSSLGADTEIAVEVALDADFVAAILPRGRT